MSNNHLLHRNLITLNKKKLNYTMIYDLLKDIKYAEIGATIIITACNTNTLNKLLSISLRKL